MNKEDYVSFEVAKMLKEKGFNEYCGAYYHLNWDDMTEEECFEYAPNHDFRNKDNGYRVGSPTLYEAQKWLRKQGVFIVITPRYTDKYQIIEYEYRIIQYTDLIDKNRKGKLCYVVYESFEECLNEGILESLKFI